MNSMKTISKSYSKFQSLSHQQWSTITVHRDYESMVINFIGYLWIDTAVDLNRWQTSVNLLDNSNVACEALWKNARRTLCGWSAWSRAVANWRSGAADGCCNAVTKSLTTHGSKQKTLWLENTKPCTSLIYTHVLPCQLHVLPCRHMTRLVLRMNIKSMFDDSKDGLCVNFECQSHHEQNQDLVDTHQADVPMQR